MFCPTCGANNQASQTVCVECARPLAGAPVPPPAQPPSILRRPGQLAPPKLDSLPKAPAAAPAAVQTVPDAPPPSPRSTLEAPLPTMPDAPPPPMPDALPPTMPRVDAPTMPKVDAPPVKTQTEAPRAPVLEPPRAAVSPVAAPPAVVTDPPNTVATPLPAPASSPAPQPSSTAAPQPSSTAAKEPSPSQLAARPPAPPAPAPTPTPTPAAAAPPRALAAQPPRAPSSPAGAVSAARPPRRRLTVVGAPRQALAGLIDGVGIAVVIFALVRLVLSQLGLKASVQAVVDALHVDVMTIVPLLLMVPLGATLWHGLAVVLGATPGQRAAELRLVTTTGAAPAKARLVLRAVVQGLSIGLFLCGPAFAFFLDGQRRGPGDVVARTVAVRHDPSTALKG